MMKVLALELSTAQASLAWIDDAAVASAQPDQAVATQMCTWPNDRKNSGQFFETLQRTIQQFGLPQTIVVGLGPGSYAGVRIAISAAIGLQAAAGAALLGYPSVCTLASGTENYAVIGDARRQSFFFVRVNGRRLMGDFELHDENALRQRIKSLAQDVPLFSSDRLPQFQPRVQQRFPSAEILGQLTSNADRKFVQPPLEPIYLREANVTIPKPFPKGAVR